MKKLNIILMTSTLFLGTSTSVQAASGWWFAGGPSGAVVWLAIDNVETIEEIEERKAEKKRQAKIKKIKKKARAALRKRAEAEYDHRHAPHKRH
jgi:hypothetical protein